jgi:signal transduction histidine kinase
MSDLPAAIEEKVQHMLPRNLLHDLRTPLGHVLGYSELLIDQLNDAGHEEFVPYAEKIRKAARELLVIMAENFQSSREDAAASPASPPIEVPEEEARAIS